MNNLALKNLFYSKVIFSMYDKLVLKYAMPIIWKCKVADIENFYNNHITINHLDIAAGTGFFLNNCKSLPDNTRLTVMDINPVCLDILEKQLQRFNTKVYKQDIMKPIEGSEKYSSIGLSLLLHCLPGDMKSKEIVFRNIKKVLKSDGTVFGTTFIYKNQKVNLLTRFWAFQYNFMGLLNNHSDTLLDLKTILDKNFQEYNIETIGHCVFFTAKKYK